MGQKLFVCCRAEKIGTSGGGSRQFQGSTKRNFDPDEKWSNLYREREKNNLYKWVGVRSGGDLITVYEKEGEEGVLKFAAEKLESMMYENGVNTQVIKFSDYVRWKKSMSLELGLDDNESFDENNSKFREHEAQWRLNKRGVDGETIIHLLLNREEPSCAEIARILIHRYPGLAKDIYMGEEMFGQSALHLAIVHDDYDTVQLLLEKGAAVNARACGNFFLPDDVSENNVRTYTYQGYSYYGEYPLAFAACFGNKDIYDLLIQHGANPDLQDLFGNTCLHMCVINYSSSMYSYAVRHWHKPAKTNIANTAGYTPLTLATKLGRRHIFEEMLELMKVEFWRFSDMTCSAYPLDTLDTIRPDGSTNYDSALMTVINGNTPEHLDMIGSEVIQRLLADKWKAFAARKMYERLALLAFHLVCLCFVVYLRPTETDRLYMRKPQWDDYLRSVFEVLTILSCVWFVFGQQVGDLRTQGFYGYIKNLTTAPAKIVYLVANICLLLCVPFRFTENYDIEEGLLIFSLPGSWIFLLFFARSAKLTGPFVQMIYSMIGGDMIRFGIISAIFLVSFSQVFYFVGKDMAAKQKLPPNNTDYCNVEGYSIYTYSSFLETFVTLFRASMGGYDYEEFGCSNYESLTKTLFVLYMFVMPIMMINILIAMMGREEGSSRVFLTEISFMSSVRVSIYLFDGPERDPKSNTYTTVITQAEKAWRQQYAKILMVLERSVNKEKLASAQLEYSIKLNESSRGLMVIKQTKKTRARQRKQAINNWKKIKRNVMKMVEKYGAEQTKFLLHSHDRIILEETVTGNVDAAAAVVNLARSSSNLTPSRSESEQLNDVKRNSSGDLNDQAKQKSQPNMNERVRTADSIALPDIRRLSDYVTYQKEPGSTTSPPTDQRQRHGYVHVTHRTLVAATGVKVRGTDMLPSVDIPNIPTSLARNNSMVTLNLDHISASPPPARLLSPPIRFDMLKRD